MLAPYALVPNVDVRVTSDLKRQGDKLWLLRVGDKQRLGGSAFAQVLSQLGDEAPDIEDAAALKAVFQAVQDLVRTGAIVACHDVSDGGLIVTLLEMAFAGDKGWRVEIEGGAEEADLYAVLFAEEAGVVVEVTDEVRTREILDRHGVTATELGLVQGLNLDLRFNQRAVLQEPVQGPHATWEETGYQLDRLQITGVRRRRNGSRTKWRPLRARIASASTRTSRSRRLAVLERSPPRPPSCARKAPTATGRWRPHSSPPALRPGTSPNVADLITDAIDLERFHMVVFPGGFSFADVLDSGKGWASVILNNARLSEEFSRFFARADTLSLGVCNGGQLMALLGIPGFDLPDTLKPRFVKNDSERFESRFSTVRVDKARR